jgi:hypothetical protein
MTTIRLKRLISYVLKFGIARGALFAAPLLLANLLAREDYGLLEWALATALLAASTASLGTASVVPLVLLGQNRDVGMRGIVSHHLGLALLCVALTLVGGAFGLSSIWRFAALLTAATALQSLASTHLKTLGHGDRSVMMDAGLFLLMVAAVLLASLVRPSAALASIWIAAGLYSAGLALFYVRYLGKLAQAGEATRWRAALRAGSPLMLGGIVSFLATTSGRLGTGLLGGAALTATYASLARATAISMVMHQLIVIARFRHLFTADDEQVARATTGIVTLVSLSALGFWLLAPWLAPLLGSAFAQAWRTEPVSGLWLTAHSILWCAIALNDLVITRHQMMPRVLPVTITALVAGLAVGFAILQSLGLSLQHFVFVHGLVMLAFYFAQSAAMYARGIRVWRTWLCAVGAYLGMALLALIP